MGEDLLKAIEQSRLEGVVTNSINSTFLTLIPKFEKPYTFADFRPISLCNLVYKTISKIDALCLKPFLYKEISAQQFGFLKDRQITEPVALPRSFSIP